MAKTARFYLCYDPHRAIDLLVLTVHFVPVPDTLCFTSSGVQHLLDAFMAITCDYSGNQVSVDIWFELGLEANINHWHQC